MSHFKSFCITAIVSSVLLTASGTPLVQGSQKQKASKPEIQSPANVTPQREGRSFDFGKSEPRKVQPAPFKSRKVPPQHGVYVTTQTSAPIMTAGFWKKLGRGFKKAGKIIYRGGKKVYDESKELAPIITPFILAG
jgi:hypothetical protein